MYRELHGNTNACGESSSDHLGTGGETALVEAGTRHQIWPVPYLSQFWIMYSFNDEDFPSSVQEEETTAVSILSYMTNVAELSNLAEIGFA